MEKKRSTKIWCAKNVRLPDELRDQVGSVQIYCGKQEDEKGNLIPGSVNISAHGIKNDHGGFHNFCESRGCIHNTQLRPPNEPSIFSFFRK